MKRKKKGYESRGPSPSDEKQFKAGPIVAGRQIAAGPDDDSEHGCKSIGAFPHDHPIYRMGCLILGRPWGREDKP